MFKTVIDEVAMVEMPKCEKAYIQVITKSDPDFIVRKITLKNGGFMPNHTNLISHQQVVLSGEAMVYIGDEKIHAKAGDFLYIPTGIAHKYEAVCGADYEFLCMICTKPDKIEMV